MRSDDVASNFIIHDSNKDRPALGIDALDTPFTYMCPRKL